MQQLRPWPHRTTARYILPYSTKYQGAVYPFFCVVILLLIFVPATFVFLRHHYKTLSSSVVICACEACTKKLEKFKRKRLRNYVQPSFILLLAVIIGGWTAILLLGTRIYETRQQIQVWDPFHLLEVSSFSSNAYIRRKYKRQSLKFHPDKQPKGMTKEEAEKMFIEITKAYKA
jgi:translocation protein SEC63